MIKFYKRLHIEKYKKALICFTMKNTSRFKLINCAKYAVGDKKRKKSNQQNEYSHICIFENKACFKNT